MSHHPSLTMEAVTAPAPATLRITDGGQGKAEVPVVRSLAFQLTIKKDRVTPDVVKSMYFLFISLIVLLFMLIVYVAIYGRS